MKTLTSFVMSDCVYAAEQFINDITQSTVVECPHCDGDVPMETPRAASGECFQRAVQRMVERMLIAMEREMMTTHPTTGPVA